MEVLRSEDDQPSRPSSREDPQRGEEEEGFVLEEKVSASNGGNNKKQNDRTQAAPTRKLARVDIMAGGGRYIPPAKRRQMMEEAARKEAEDQEAAGGTASATASETQKDSVAVQRQTWQDQKRVVHGTINRLNAATIKPLIGELFENVNVMRLRGVLARSILQAAVTSSSYANVYAALVAVINTKLPEVGELVVKRSILAFRRHYKRREKANCLAMAIFLGHLFHQSVVHEFLILQILTVLLDGDPTDDSVEVAVQFMSVVGQALLEVSPAGVRAVLERLRALLHEGQLNSRVEYKMEQLLAMRKKGFRDLPPLIDELDLVERDDQITFELSLDDEDITKEETLDVFHADEKYEESERAWAEVRAEILGLNGDDDGSGDSETDDSDASTSDDDDESEEAPEDGNDPSTALAPSKGQTLAIQDLSEADLIHLRRTIYLTIMSSATFEECAHKLTKINIPSGREEELINMIIECCSQERTFLRYYGLIAARFCLLDDRWTDAFLAAFIEQYTTIHRLETNKLRNVAKLFAHLLHTDSVPWSCLSTVHLNEDETSSSSRIFVKILVQEMAEAIGIVKLKNRFETDDPEHVEWYKGMFPKDNVRNTRYAINFFTSIGLGPLTDDLREFLKNAPKLILAQAQAAALAKKKEEEDGNDDDSSLSSSSSSSSSGSSSLSTSSYTSSSSSSYSSSSSEDSRRGRRSRRRGARSRRRRSYSSSSSSSSGSRSSYSSRSSSRSRSASRSPPRRKHKRSPRSYSSDSQSRSSKDSRARNKGSRGRRDRSASSGSYSRNGQDDDRRPSSSPRKKQDKETKEASPKKDDQLRKDRNRSKSPESNSRGERDGDNGSVESRHSSPRDKREPTKTNDRDRRRRSESSGSYSRSDLDDNDRRSPPRKDRKDMKSKRASSEERQRSRNRSRDSRSRSGSSARSYYSRDERGNDRRSRSQDREGNRADGDKDDKKRTSNRARDRRRRSESSESYDSRDNGRDDNRRQKRGPTKGDRRGSRSPSPSSDSYSSDGRGNGRRSASSHRNHDDGRRGESSKQDTTTDERKRNRRPSRSPSTDGNSDQDSFGRRKQRPKKARRSSFSSLSR